jgi:hypothetical protein
MILGGGGFFADPMSARSKAWVCDRSLAGIMGSNPTRKHGCLSGVSVVGCRVEVSASGRSLVQRSPTQCGVSACDREVSIMRRPWPTGGCCGFGRGGGAFSPWIKPW